ncbi:MAG: hypothetical protein FJ109_16220 [Deltaproteobacteria bacterium]|nr:hypothetical protein [Deltaproteobacteria bacterium]
MASDNAALSAIRGPSLTLRVEMTAALLALALLVSSSALGQHPDPPCPIELRKLEEGPKEELPRQEGDYRVDEQHRRFRTRFDPGNRWRIGTAWGASLELGEEAAVQPAAWELSTVIDLRTDCNFDEEGCWKGRHALAAFTVAPTQVARSGWPVMDLLLYEGEFIRHRRSPHIVIPTLPPRRLFVPFDFGVSIRTAGLHVPRDFVPHASAGADGAVVSAWDVEVIDIRMLLELWRSERLGSALVLGIGSRYDLRVTDDGNELSLEHVLSPFTATSLTFRHEWAQGRQRIDVTADSHPFWSSRIGISNAFDASARYDITLLAINDQPVSLNLSADYRYGDFSPGPRASDHLLQLMAGLEFGVE